MLPSFHGPAVGRGARYFLLGLALPTFLSLLHLNLKASPGCTHQSGSPTHHWTFL